MQSLFLIKFYFSSFVDLVFQHFKFTINNIFISDGSYISGAGQGFMCYDKMDKAFGILCHLHRLTNENLEVSLFCYIIVN